MIYETVPNFRGYLTTCKYMNLLSVLKRLDRLGYVPDWDAIQDQYDRRYQRQIDLQTKFNLLIRAVDFPTASL